VAILVQKMVTGRDLARQNGHYAKLFERSRSVPWAFRDVNVHTGCISDEIFWLFAGASVNSWAK
jgi:hypothetical protein